MKIIDLSIPVEDGLPSDPPPQVPHIEYLRHRDTAQVMTTCFNGDISVDDLPEGNGWAIENVRLTTHSGTHLDAPYHYYPTMNGGERAWTISEIPLEWCVGNGVKMDFSDKPDGYKITTADVEKYFNRVGYTPKEGDIVLLYTGADRRWGTADYLLAGAGMSAEATIWLIDHGVKVMGTDGWSWDVPLPIEAQEFAKNGDTSIIWEGHRVGRQKAYCHLEKLTNLDRLPLTDYQVSCLPVNVKDASAGWCRAVAIGFAGTTVTLAPGFTIQYGLTGGLAWSLIYSMCGLLLFGLVYSNFIRRSGAQTLPEFLEMRYDGRTRSVVAITSVIGMCGIMANNVVSSVDNIVAFTGWNRLLITAVIFAVIIIFTFVSGLRATTITDLFQVLIGVIVVPATFFLLAGSFGWIDAIFANWNPGDFVSRGFVSAMPGMKLTYPSIFNYVICFAVALVWGNNYYWMKVANCRSEKVARNSFVIAAILLAIVFMVPLCFIGGYMGAFYPEQLTLNGGTVAPTGTYGYVAGTFVSLFGSLVVISAVAASTASTSALGASAVANRDIYQRLINPNADAKTSLRMSKIIMLLIGIVTFVLCQFPGGPTYLFAFANCWLVPPAILLGLGTVWPRFNDRGALWGAVCGMIIIAAFTFLQLTNIFNVGSYVYLATLGLVVTLVAAVIASLFGQPKYFGQPGWERVPTATNRKDVKLGGMEKQILEMLRVGHCYMSDFTDALGVDSKTSGEAVENLDQGGYIIRAGMSGSKFYTFEITEKGLAVLPKLGKAEADMAAEYLTPLYVGLMKVVRDNPNSQAEYIQKNGIRSMRMSAICSHLTRRGYVVEGGLFRCKLRLTEKGLAAVQKYENYAPATRT